MRFFALLPFLGLAVASLDARGAPSSSDCDDAAKPTVSPAYHQNADGTCDHYAETCYVTVTASHGPYATGNATATPAVSGTASAVSPTKAYYSNAANPLTGGAVAVGAGILGALFL